MYRTIILISIMALILLIGCARHSEELVPNGVVHVYDSPVGGRLVGTADGPMDIVGYDYPDKTRYVVKVCFKGVVGYVRDGSKSIRRAGVKRMPHCVGKDS